MTMGFFDSFREDAYPHRFHCEIRVGALAGGVPLDPNVAEGWLRSKIADKDDLRRQAIAEYALENGVDVEEAASAIEKLKHHVGFRRGDDGLFVRGYTIKAMIKEATNIARAADKIDARFGATSKGALGFATEHIFIPEDRVYLGVTEPTGLVQSFPENKRVGMRGIQYQEYVEDAHVAFTVQSDWDFGDKWWAMVWLTAQENGFGAGRSQGFGRFEVLDWSPITGKTTTKRRRTPKK